jgi:hypothetical protein
VLFERLRTLAVPGPHTRARGLDDLRAARDGAVNDSS